MEIEVLGQTTILNEISSPINKSELKETKTNNLRIILSEELTEIDIKLLSNFSKSYIKTRIVVGSQKIQNFDFLNSFPFLYGFQVYGLDKDRIPELNKLPSSLKGIEIGFSAKKASLSSLLQFNELEFLSLNGSVLEIESLAKFKKLKKLNLYYAKSFDPSVLSEMPNLKELTIHHGSISNNEAFNSLKNLERIDLWKIRGLEDISWIKENKNLVSITLGALSKVENIPSLKKLNRLKYVKIEQLKALENIDNIATSPAIEKLNLVQMNQIPTKSYSSFQQHPTLKEVTTGYSSKKKRKEVEGMLKLPNVHFEPFDFMNEF